MAKGMEEFRKELKELRNKTEELGVWLAGELLKAKECTCGWDDKIGSIHDQRCPKHSDWRVPTVPITTRKDWEAFADYVAKAIMGHIEGGESRTNKIRQAILSMPGIPKEEE